MMGHVNWGIFVGLVVILTAPLCTGLTDPRDVLAINNLYVALDLPPLRHWLPLGGDPCGDEWKGVDCVFSNITAIRLNGMDLGGELSDNLDDFTSIITIDLSNNHIGGSIPLNLPATVRNLSVNNNLLSGPIPDAFQQLTDLITLDLSGNNFSGHLPPSLGDLSALNSLYLQNNKLSGTLYVLQDLRLSDLYIQNNLFSGPIPPKLLDIPNFRKGGNPFNTTILPSPPPALPPSQAEAPSSEEAPGKQANEPSAAEAPKSARARTFWTTKRFIVILISGAVIILIVLGVWLSIWRCRKSKQLNKNSERHDMGVYKGPMEKPDYSKSSLQPNYQMEKVSKEAVVKSLDGYGVHYRRKEMSPKQQDEQVIDVTRMAASSRHKKDHEIEMPGMDAYLTRLQPPPPPLPTLPVEKVFINPTVPELTRRSNLSRLNSSSASVFTIAWLQQYTNSFSEENFIGEGKLGSVYRAELPDGKLLAVKKLNTMASRWQSDEEFFELVFNISKLYHPNVVELMGYCNEHGQRLLVYEYCRNGTLHDALHMDDEIRKKLSWSVRVRMALGAARALQYLHEVCQPPIMHQNFKSANVLLDEKFAVHVSDCGLAPLASSSGSASQLDVYGGPELMLGSYTCQSDVYSLGVVMLELLTGRKSYDRSRPRGEQSLVRWAIPQLHDIDALSRMVDPSLHGAYPVKSLSRFSDIIFRCVQREPGFRPLMSEVVQDLLHLI